MADKKVTVGAVVPRRGSVGPGPDRCAFGGPPVRRPTMAPRLARGEGLPVDPRCGRARRALVVANVARMALRDGGEPVEAVSLDVVEATVRAIRGSPVRRGVIGSPG